MYIRFKILSVTPDMQKQSITIESTHEINQMSIIPSSIRITNVGDSLEEILWDPAQTEFKGKTFTLYLKDTPKINTRYLIRINHLKNVIDDTLQTEYNQSITFINYVRSTIAFKSPAYDSIVETLKLELDETLLNDNTIGATYFEYMISEDPLFHKIKYQNKFYETHVALNIELVGQIFIKCRGVYKDDEAGICSYGDWIVTTCVLGSAIAPPPIITPKDTIYLGAISFKPLDELTLQDLLSIQMKKTITEKIDYAYTQEPTGNLMLVLAIPEEKGIIESVVDGANVPITYDFVMQSIILDNISYTICCNKGPRMFNNNFSAHFNISPKVYFSDSTDRLISSQPAAQKEAPAIELPLEVLHTPASCIETTVFQFVFDTNVLVLQDDATTKMIATDLATKQKTIISHRTLVQDNILELHIQDSLPENQSIMVQLKNIRDMQFGYLKSYETEFYSVLNPCYATVDDINMLLMIDEVDEKMWYQHLFNASKLADYYQKIKLNSTLKNLRYYEANKDALLIEKQMFVKYYAASQILAQARCGVAYNNSFAGTLGEIKFEPKGAIPDLTSTLKALINEADKWKLALQGYKDHPADSTSAIKAKKCRPHDHLRSEFR